MQPAPRTSASFPELDFDAGGYESFYLKASHPSEPLAVWIRYTVRKPPRAEPLGSVWFSFFDGARGGPLAVKESGGELRSGDGLYIAVGDCRFDPGHITGAATAQGREASWQLGYSSREPPLRHLPQGWMYRAPFPRTKLESPYPDARFDGSVTFGEHSVDLGGWRGVIGHNWGAEHAERWIWLQGAAFEGNPTSWLDVALARVKAGPLSTPWIASGAFSHAGVRHRLGGPTRMRSTEVEETATSCRFTIPGRDVVLRGSVGAAPERFVAWAYADPDGPEHDVANCSIADLRLELERDGNPVERLEISGGGAYELGMRERDHGLAVEPFPDR